MKNSSGPDFFTKVSCLCGNNHYISLHNPILSNFWNNHECSSIQTRNIWGSIDFDQSQQWLFTKQASFKKRLILHPYGMAIQIDSCPYPIPISLGYHRLSRHISSLNPFLVAEILEPFAPRQQVFSFLAGAPVISCVPRLRAVCMCSFPWNRVVQQIVCWFLWIHGIHGLLANKHICCLPSRIWGWHGFSPEKAGSPQL